MKIVLIFKNGGDEVEILNPEPIAMRRVESLLLKVPLALRQAMRRKQQEASKAGRGKK